MTARRGRVLERLAALAVCISLLACQPSPSAAPTSASPPPGTATGTPSTPSPGASMPVTGDPRVDGWRDDLARIIPGLERIHPDPFHGTPKADFEAAVAALAAEVPGATDDELLVGVMRIAALISAQGCDGHSGAFIWGTGSYPVDSLPFRLWLFGDELVIVDALPPHEGLIGARVDAVEGRPIADVRAALDPVIPRDNDQTVRLLAPRHLLIPQVLRGLSLADDGPVSIDLTARDGATSSLDVEPVPMAEYNAWAGTYGMHLPDDPDVRYLSNIADDLWWEVLPDGASLYVQYNRVEHLSPATLADLGTAMRAPDVARVILDIRHNSGGEVPALDPLIAELDRPEVDVPGGLFVLVGRNTWSAGALLLARLEAQTSAMFIGEPMAGCPTFYGDTVELDLPYSGIALTITEMLEVGVDPNDQRPNIDLDAEAELTVEEWLDGEDPALDLVIATAP